MLKKGKLYIIGDSYSTFEGCIPEGFAAWYYSGGTDATDVTEKTETWWHMLISKTGMPLLFNNSWSGTTICNTTYDGAYCPDTSFIGRFDKAAAELAKNPPEVLIIFGGTNDSWSGAPVGSLQWENWTDEDLKKVLPAFCYLLCRVKKVLPKTQTAVIINTELKPEIENGMTAACEKQGIEYIKLENISKQNGHPDKEGMKQICSQVLSLFSEE